MERISLLEVSKSYDAKRQLLRDATLILRDGDRIGLIGANGAGKSTLLALLAGGVELDAGERRVRRGTRIGFLEQEPVFEPDVSIRDTVRQGILGRDALLAGLESVHGELAREGLDGDELQRLLRREESLQHELEALGGHDVEHRVESTIDAVGLPEPDALCGTLSGGEARRVALARLLISEPDVLLLDEPTNHLDAFVVAWLEARLAELTMPLVLVTHDRYLLDRNVDRIIEVSRGQLHVYEGGYGRYLELRAERLRSEERGEHNRLAQLKRETEWMRRGPLARSTKAKARIGRYEALAGAEALDVDRDLEMKFPSGRRLGNKVVSLHGVAHSFGDREVLPALDLEVDGSMRLGVVGPNGAGKSTLLKILLGALEPDRGEVQVGATVSFGTVDQKREDLHDDLSVVEEVAGDGEHVVVGKRSIHVASFLNQFLFPGDKKHMRIRSLSGGERGRVLLAKLMLCGANFLVLDEPTNDLDLPTLRALEEALIAFEGAVVVVSHDRWFLDRVATHILYIDGRGGVRLHTGGISSLFEALAIEAQSTDEGSGGTQKVAKKAQPKQPAARAQPEAPKSPKRLAPWEERELEELTEEVTRLENGLAALDTELAAPELYTGDGKRARELQGQRTDRQASLNQALSRWEELAERAG